VIVERNLKQERLAMICGGSNMDGGKELIDPWEVDKAFEACFYTDEEVKTFAEGKPAADTIIVEGIQGKFGFHPERLETQRGKVIEWLKLLPHQFRRNGGEGWSFLNACVQENGVQWTGLHRTVEELFCLAMGLGLAECQLPREMWSMFPGGMPYYVINIE
jgi:hypothetical protein